MTTDNNELRDDIEIIIVSAIADGIDAYDETGTFPPRLGNEATDKVLSIVTQAANKAAEAARINGYKEALYDSGYGFNGKLESVENKLKAFNSEQKGETA